MKEKAEEKEGTSDNGNGEAAWVKDETFDSTPLPEAERRPIDFKNKVRLGVKEQ